MRNGIFDEVKECVDFLQEYKEKISEIFDKNNMQETQFRRFQFLKEQVDYVLGLGKELYTQAENLLRKPADIDTAIYLLKNEDKYPLFFQLRRTFLSETQLVDAVCVIAKGQKSIRQDSKCFLQDVGHIYQGIILSERFNPKQLFKGNYGSDKVKGSHPADHENIVVKEMSIFTSLLFPVKRNQPLQMAIKRSLLGKDFKVYNDVNKLLTYSFKQNTVKTSVLIPGNNILYNNSLLHKMGDMVKAPAVSCYHIEISSPYANSNFDYLDLLCSYYLYEHSSRRGKQMCYALGVSETCTTLLTNFVNIFILPLEISTKDLKKVIAITGNREAECGLETLFVCFGKSDTQLSGTCVNACTLKLQCTYHGKGILCKCNRRIWTNKKLNFSLEMYTNCSFSNNIYSTYYSLKYQTEITETCVPADFLKSLETRRQEQTCCLKTIHHTEKAIHQVPVKYLKLDLLCGFENMLYFVRHEFPNNLCIGILTFTLTGVKLNTLCQVTENDMGIPISSLKPLTMTKTETGEIITVCSVKNDNSKFVMIRPDKSDTSPIEFLDVSYPTSAEISEAWVDELEMSPEGDIVYVLKDKDGKSHSVLTKYLI